MRGQSRRWSLFEVTTNIVTGSILGMVMNMLILPLWGFTVSVGSAVGIGVVYSAISFVRSYLFRRLFNWLDVRRQRDVQ